ncbi:hypothetical protein DJ013_06770 [Arcticibacterium luteifluviistationis]|uniref:LamG-like jellyroll fold domain-containing protein n=2 Tax=Arcticibacterium luteifluviistationis TaxID=1784714 RepID=A0A2Z4GHL7_9BACT|nr:hypothetical protein DJ013_06770 [Arcticibacterium luteifluviistationis]
MQTVIKTTLLVFLVTTFLSNKLAGQGQYTKPNKALIQKLKATENLVALWQFKEKSGKSKKATGMAKFPLKESDTGIKVLNQGPLSGHSIELTGNQYLTLANTEVKALNITEQVTVLAWVKWTGEQTGFVGGLWNEYQDGGKRQYGLFISLPHYNGDNQVCGHISKTGRPTPPYPYSLDYSASKQKVTPNEWAVVAFTYDGTYAKSYLNGIFEPREPELILHTEGFKETPDGLTHSKNPYYFPDGMGDNVSDFTVGAVLLKRGMGNFFKGQIGGLVVFDRALDEKEIKVLSEI